MGERERKNDELRLLFLLFRINIYQIKKAEPCLIPYFFFLSLSLAFAPSIRCLSMLLFHVHHYKEESSSAFLLLLLFLDMCTFNSDRLYISQVERRSRQPFLLLLRLAIERHRQHVHLTPKHKNKPITTAMLIENRETLRLVAKR